MYNNQKLSDFVILLFRLLLNYHILLTAVYVFDLYYLKNQESGILPEGLSAYWGMKSYIVYYSSLLLPLFVAVVFMGWFYREYWNLQYRYYNGTFKYRLIGAIFSFIIPVFNLFGPYIIMKEIVQGHEAYYRKKISVKYIKVWWFTFIGHSIYANIIAFRLPTTNDEYFMYTLHQIAINIIGIVSLVYFISLLKQLRSEFV